MGSDGGLEATATIGREPELAAIREWVLGDGHLRALVIEGAPGLGKTTLWDSARSFATGAGARVLPARAAEAETSLSFAVLSDLLADVDVGGIAGVPPPQARALEVALLRADPGDRPIESRAVALGLLNVLQGLAADGPLLLAVDDLQWVDP